MRMKAKRMRMGRPPKIHAASPFVSDASGEKDKIRWLLDNVRVSRPPTAHTANSVCHTSPENATAVVAWLATQTHDVPTRKHGAQVELSCGRTVVDWLRLKAVEHDLGEESVFHRGLAAAEIKRKKFYEMVDQERARLIAKIQARDGHKGCHDCGREHGICFEFDHIVPHQFTGCVGELLAKGKWADAEREADKCELRCRACHLRKTVANKDYASEIKKPCAKERYTGERKQMQLYRSRGIQRAANAKLSQKQCAVCNVACTAQTLQDFEFDHMDGSTKTYSISAMTNYSDDAFNKELAKCQLLCVPCHRKRTREQNRSGATSRVRALNKNKRARIE